jgi:hypothetical protein
MTIPSLQPLNIPADRIFFGRAPGWQIPRAEMQNLGQGCHTHSAGQQAILDQASLRSP